MGVGGADGEPVDRRTREGGKGMRSHDRLGQHPADCLGGRDRLGLDPPPIGETGEETGEGLTGRDEPQELRHGHPGMRKPASSR
jgi:hypothetical protein